MMTVPVHHFRSAVLDAWRFHVFARLSERQGFLGDEFTSSHLLERDKMLLRAFLCGRWGVGTDSFLTRPRRKTFLVVFAVRVMVMVTHSGSVLSLTPSTCSGSS